MSKARIIIISGACGTGKSTIARILAEQSGYERAVNVHTDDFYAYIKKGYVSPWKPEAEQQNTVVAETLAVCAENFAKGGYEVYVDGVIGPWFLDPWIKAARGGTDIYYIILRPDLHTAVSRGVNRKGPHDLTDAAVIEKMWAAFADAGLYEAHVIDTSAQTIEESVTAIKSMLDGDCLRIY